LRNGRIKDGLSCTVETYLQARSFAERCRSVFADSFGQCDVLLTTAAAGEAPLGLSSTGNASPSTLWTVLHAPSVTIPAFRGPNGLPVGAQLIGKRNQDRNLFAAARWVSTTLESFSQ
jgi:amidase